MINDKHWVSSIRNCFSLRCLIYFLVLNHPSFATPAKKQDWQGLYFGTTAGTIFSSFKTNTSTMQGSLFTQEDAVLVNSAGEQSMKTTGFLAGITSGYNWQLHSVLFGIEGDLQSLSTNGITYSDAIAYQGNSAQFVLTSYVENNWLFTARPRLGFITNSGLLYATTGLALAYLNSDFLFSNNNAEFKSQRIRQVQPGFVAGAGVEASITNHVRFKTEYLFATFPTANGSSMSQTKPQTFINSARIQSQALRLGLNYHPDEQIATPWLKSLHFDSNQWQNSIGTRVFFSTGTLGAPQPLLNTSYNGDVLASRLTFSGLSTTSAEVFAHVEHSSGLFAKGYLAAGTISNGQLNDEDFPAGANVYSNTLSTAQGNLSYANADLGYYFLNQAPGKVGAFVGYHYYAQDIKIYNCQQLAGSSTCVPTSFLRNYLVLSENDQFNSLRLGLASEFNLTSHWSLTSEAAYLPWVNFSGTDMHNARELIGPESAQHGDGTMLETILNYQLNDDWRMGLGGRYWAWNMRDGQVIFDFLGENNTPIVEPARYHATRYGGFLQINYQNAAPKSDITEFIPNWKGLYLDASLGGAWNNGYWSDPFASTVDRSGYLNVAGFGNLIRSSGPTAGIGLHANGQNRHLIFGFGAQINAADLRGENTLFSGIGGINGQKKSDYILTMMGRLGTSIERSILYVQAGPAMLHTQYELLANTDLISLGVESVTLSTWGWTSGIGVEYALSNAWSTQVEYDYFNFACQGLSFPNIEMINTQSISEHQTMGTVKLGVNYKLNALG